MRSFAVSLILLFSSYSLLKAEPGNPGKLIAAAAKSQIGKTLHYDPAYVRLAYPGGDVPIERGVCSDVVIRAFRQIEIDLQVKVHEDMKRAFDRYPKVWGLSHPDKNIDHRRVLNLTTYFSRAGFSLPLSKDAAQYLPGDIVAWRLDNGLPHIGIVADQMNSKKTAYMVVHNIGAGTRLEDVLFEYKIIGHFRYRPPKER